MIEREGRLVRRRVILQRIYEGLECDTDLNKGDTVKTRKQ